MFRRRRNCADCVGALLREAQKILPPPAKHKHPSAHTLRRQKRQPPRSGGCKKTIQISYKTAEPASSVFLTSIIL